MPPFAEEHRDNSSGTGRPDTDRECPACSNNSARLLIESALYDFYYCFHCREWSRGRFTGPKAIFLVRDTNLSKALTRFYLWKLEFAHEMNVMNSLRSIWRGLKARPALEQ